MTKLASKCKICGDRPAIFSKFIGLCPECIKNHPDRSLEISKSAFQECRAVWDLPSTIPNNRDGIKCHICSNECSIALGEIGYCGAWINDNGILKPIAGKNKAFLHTYLDPLPTNCCSMYFCPGGTSTGYPKYTYVKGVEHGYYNLACFFYGCNFSCLGCQNDQHRAIRNAERYSLEKFVNIVENNTKISCICWFGGSPEPQLPWALRASRLSYKSVIDRILRICWEWNGAGNQKLVESALKISLITGGNAKFDLKYYSSTLSQIISGVSNEQSYKNFKHCFDKFYNERPRNPVLTATTLLIPGYVDQNEVESIAKFLAELDCDIPYSLLVFHPQSFLTDLPITPKKQVKQCYNVAIKYLTRVQIGNKHLLGLLV
jgi:pyruvate formate lyase activating enzyme